MSESQYRIVSPKVHWRMYWIEIALLVASILSPVVAWAAWATGSALARSGSVMVFFAVAAEFFILNKATRKHLLNAARVRNGEDPWDFSQPAKIVGVASLVAAAIGTVLWGFGDLLVAA